MLQLDRRLITCLPADDDLVVPFDGPTASSELPTTIGRSSFVAGLPGIEVMAHGVSIRPGKPTLLACCSEKAVIGLPGHPVSALVVAQVFLAPFLRYLQGGNLEKGPQGHRVQALLSTSVHSTIGLEEYVRVRLEEVPDGTLTAHPVFGKSGMLSTMVKAGGIITIPMNAEGFSKGETVQVVQL